MPTLSLVRKQQLHKVAIYDLIILILCNIALEPIPATAHVTTTDVQGVIIPDIDQGENNKDVVESCTIYYKNLIINSG